MDDDLEAQINVTARLIAVATGASYAEALAFLATWLAGRGTVDEATDSDARGLPN